MQQEKKTLQIGIYRRGAWGDVMVTTPVLYELGKKYPNAEITVMGSGLWPVILIPELWPAIRQIIHIESRPEIEHYYQKNNQQWVEQPAPDLKEIFRSFDIYIHLRPESPRLAFFAHRAGVKKRIGSGPPYLWFLFTHWSPWLGKEPLIHERDRLLQIIDAPERPTCPAPLLYNRYLQKKETTFLEKVAELEEPMLLQNKRLSFGATRFNYIDKGLVKIKPVNPDKAQKLTGLPAGHRYWLINPTASRRKKAWPAGRFAELIKRLKPHLEKQKIDLIIIGARHEREWLEQAASSEKIVYPDSFMDIFDVVAQAQQLITNASSMQFIAASTKTPVLTIMGRAQPERWGPLGENTKVIKGKVTLLNRLRKLPEQEKKAYETITVDQVFEVCMSLLTSGQSG